MPRLTYAQMEGYWIRAGGPPAVAPVAAAIGEAESGGNTDAVNPKDNNGRQSSYGWLQISNGTHAPPAPNWADPLENARLGVAKYQGKGGNFTDWGTYNSGAYRGYMSGSTTPDLNVQGNPQAISAEQSASSSADCLFGFGGIPGTSFINDIFGSGGNVGQFCLFTRSNARAWIGAGLMIGGAMIAGVGLAFLIFGAGERTRLGGAVLGAVTRGTMGRVGQAEQQAAAEQRSQRAQQRAAARAAQQPQGRHAGP